MISFKQYLNEDAGDRAAQKDREWLAKKIDLLGMVKKQLDDSVRTAHNLNHITSAHWSRDVGRPLFWSSQESNNLRVVMNTLSPPLRKAAVVFALRVVDTRPLTLSSPLSKDGLPFDAVVVVEPVNGDMIAVPSLRQPHKSTFSNGRGALGHGDRLANMFRIDKVVKAATKNLVFYARNHHKTRRG